MAYKITIEDSEGHKATLNCEHTHLFLERGMRYLSGDEDMEIFPNGQSRILIKGWTGCKSYEDFQTDAKKKD